MKCIVMTNYFIVLSSNMAYVAGVYRNSSVPGLRDKLSEDLENETEDSRSLLKLTDGLHSHIKL